MKDMNKVILMGRLGADPVMRNTSKGTAVVHFPLATSKKRRKAEDDPSLQESKYKESTEWHQVVVWGRMAENCHRFLKKGHAMFVVGEIQSHVYQKEGQERRAFEIVARDVGFLDNLGRATSTSLNSSSDLPMNVPA